MTRSLDRDPMHDVVAGESENLLNSGVVAGGESFREGVVGSGFGLSGKSAEPQHMGATSLGRMAAGTMANELDDTDEFEGACDAYDAANGGLAVRRRLARKRPRRKRPSHLQVMAQPLGLLRAAKRMALRLSMTQPRPSRRRR